MAGTNIAEAVMLEEEEEGTMAEERVKKLREEEGWRVLVKLWRNEKKWSSWKRGSKWKEVGKVEEVGGAKEVQEVKEVGGAKDRRGDANSYP